MKNLCKFLSFLILILSINLTAFAQESEVDIAVTAFNSDGEAFGEVTIYIYSLNEETGEYQQSETGFMTNSDTLTNNIPVALGATFYAKGFDAEGNVYQYSDDPDNDNNIWTILSDNVIENVDTGETRIPYVEIYPSSESINTYDPDSSDDTSSDDTSSDDTSSDDTSDDVDESETSTVSVDMSEFEQTVSGGEGSTGGDTGSTSDSGGESCPM